MSDGNINGQAVRDGLISPPADWNETMAAVAGSIAEALPGVHFTIFFYRPGAADGTVERSVISTLQPRHQVEYVRDWLHVQQFGKRDELIAGMRQAMQMAEQNHQRIVTQVWRDAWKAARVSANILPMFAEKGADEAWIKYVDEQERAGPGAAAKAPAPGGQA